MTHEIKISQRYFDAVASGAKTFEVRENDRDYQQGETVVLFEAAPMGIRTTGNKIIAEVGFVTDFQQREGFVVFSLLNVKVVRANDTN